MATFVALQPILHQKLYQSDISFFDKNNEFLQQVVSSNKWDKTATTKVFNVFSILSFILVVLLPETYGSWLAAVNSPSVVFKSSTLMTAMLWLILSNFFQLLYYLALQVPKLRAYSQP
jgi:hypothetical protein